MKAVFTCDEVFDVLTREPFPSGDPDDEIVESHLAVCHECRQLAEAFRPAVGLFHEATSTGLEGELPSYHKCRISLRKKTFVRPANNDTRGRRTSWQSLRV